MVVGTRLCDAIADIRLTFSGGAGARSVCLARRFLLTAPSWLAQLSCAQSARAEGILARALRRQIMSSGLGTTIPNLGRRVF